MICHEAAWCFTTLCHPAAELCAFAAACSAWIFPLQCAPADSVQNQGQGQNERRLQIAETWELFELVSELQSGAAALYSANCDKSMNIHYSVRTMPNKLHCIASGGLFKLCSRGRVFRSHLYCSSRSPGRVIHQQSRTEDYHSRQLIRKFESE